MRASLDNAKKERVAQEHKLAAVKKAEKDLDEQLKKLEQELQAICNTMFLHYTFYTMLHSHGARPYSLLPHSLPTTHYSVTHYSLLTTHSPILHPHCATLQGLAVAEASAKRVQNQFSGNTSSSGQTAGKDVIDLLSSDDEASGGSTAGEHGSGSGSSMESRHVCVVCV